MRIFDYWTSFTGIVDRHEETYNTMDCAFSTSVLGGSVLVTQSTEAGLGFWRLLNLNSSTNLT